MDALLSLTYLFHTTWGEQSTDTMGPVPSIETHDFTASLIFVRLLACPLRPGPTHQLSADESKKAGAIISLLAV